METTDGFLLGGRVRYAQPRHGYRTGIEPVLLAASVPAQPGARVLEAGTGAGAALLCLAARVGDITGLGVERDPAMADLARRNLADNGATGLAILTADIGRMAPVRVDHAFANPPWHPPRSTPSPNPARRQAKQDSGEDLERWIAAIAPMLAPGGTLTVIIPAAQAPRARTAFAATACHGGIIHWLPPKLGRPPKLVLLQARDRATAWSESTTVLHEPNGQFTAPIEAVLRHGHPLDPSSRSQTDR